MARTLKIGLGACAAIMLASCSGGGGGSERTGGSEAANFNCDGSCANRNLTVAEVRQVVAQAVAASEALGVASTIAVLDRVGNVLAVYEMPGATPSTTVNGARGAVGGLEGVAVPATLAAISKGGTGAYLSSQGNAFSTRTASQIIQENFNPGERDQPAGPLFGVQFSQLLCSDVTVRNSEAALPIRSGTKASAGGLIGPRALPLGLSADPGGIPLYKGGDVVGGVGVEFDGLYTLDLNIRDYDDDPEERVALSASRGFEAPAERVASNVLAGGRSLRYTDLGYSDLASELPLPSLDDSRFVAVPEFTTGVVREGATFGSASSGVVRTVRAGLSVMTLVGPDGGERFPTRGGTPLPGGVQLTAQEVSAILDSALLTSARTRAAIRRPLDSPAHVSIWVTDTSGEPLGFTRSFDAPVFGIDVALQKSRTAALFSSPEAAQRVNGARANNSVGGFDDYVAQTQRFLGADALTSGTAFSTRAVGNLSRPFFPDGVEQYSNGPLSLPFPGTAPGRTFSPFNVGLQLDLVFQRLVAPLGVPVAPRVLPDTCTDPSALGKRLANGAQIFAGAVPLYRGATLIGAIGISGDGTSQDDLIAFYGASRQGLDYAGHSAVGDSVLGFNAPVALRSDQRAVQGDDLIRLRYVNCPEAPFISSNEQNVCDGL